MHVFRVFQAIAQLAADLTESKLAFKTSGCFKRSSFVALLRNDNSAAFKRTCILVCWPVMKILKPLNHFCDHKRLSAGANVKRVQQTSQSREKSHTEREMGREDKEEMIGLAGER